MTRALLLVDCQRLFLDPMSPAVLPSSRRSAAAAAALLREARAAGRPVAHARFETRPGTPLARRYRAVAPGSRLAEFWPTLSPARGEGVFIKEGYGAFRGTRLGAWLKRRGVRRLDLAGFMTDRCVLATAFEAFAEGLSVTLRADACAARTSALHRSALTVLSRACAEVA